MSSRDRLTVWQKTCCLTGALLVGCGILLVATQWLPASIIGSASFEDPPSALKTPNPSIAVLESLSLADLLVYHQPYWAGMMPVCIVACIGVGAALLLVPFVATSRTRGSDFSEEANLE